MNANEEIFLFKIIEIINKQNEIMTNGERAKEERRTNLFIIKN